jgi:thiaminase
MCLLCLASKPESLLELLPWHAATPVKSYLISNNAVARMQSVTEILAAMAPCARLYAFLGCTLNAAFPAAEHAYAKWIRNYSKPDFLVRAAALTSL